LGFADDRFEGGNGGVFLEQPQAPVAAIQDMIRVPPTRALPLRGMPATHHGSNQSR
jgi:hypothetical protein